jgi:hypothetical protein
MFFEVKNDVDYEYNNQFTIKDLGFFLAFGVVLAPLMTVICPIYFLKRNKDFILIRWGDKKKDEKISS